MLVILVTLAAAAMFLFTGFYAVASLEAMESRQRFWRLKQGSWVYETIQSWTGHHHPFWRWFCGSVHGILAGMTLKGVVVAFVLSCIFATTGHLSVERLLIVNCSIMIGGLAFILYRYGYIVVNLLDLLGRRRTM